MAKRTVVVVVTRNARGLLQRIMASFAHQGLSVTEATIKTLPGDIARDTFEVVSAASGEPVASARERRAIEERLRRDLWPGAFGAQLPSNEIRVSVPDRPGLLSEITASLSDLNLSIVGASIQVRSV